MKRMVVLIMLCSLLHLSCQGGPLGAKPPVQQAASAPAAARVASAPREIHTKHWMFGYPLGPPPRVGGKTVRKYTLRQNLFLFKDIQRENRGFSTESSL
jgi:hypothetical protein